MSAKHLSRGLASLVRLTTLSSLCLVGGCTADTADDASLSALGDTAPSDATRVEHAVSLMPRHDNKEAGGVHWARSYFGQSSPYPRGWLNPIRKKYSYANPYDITQTSDGGYLVAGNIRTFEEDDGFALKLSSSGRVEKGFSIHGGYAFGKRRQAGMLRAVQEVEGGYVLAGSAHPTSSRNVLLDGGGMWVLKLDFQHRIVWSRDFGGGTVADIAPAPDGGLLLAGHQIAKINANGAIVWSKTIPFASASKIQPVSHDGYVLVANAVDDESNRIVRIDENGAVVWSREYQVPGVKAYLTSAIPTFDEAGDADGYIIVGSLIYQETRSADALAFRIDRDGHLVWQQSFDGGRYDPANLIFSEEGAANIVASHDGNFVIGSYSESFEDALNDNDAVVVKISGDGDVLWQKAYSIADEGLGGMARTRDGFAFVSGLRDGGSFPALVVTCDDEGNLPAQGSQSRVQIRNIEYLRSVPNGTVVELPANTALEDVQLVTSENHSTIRDLRMEVRQY